MTTLLSLFHSLAATPQAPVQADRPAPPEPPSIRLAEPFHGLFVDDHLDAARPVMRRCRS
ncbi:MAG: hypothetical protein KDC98_17185 [Planctomycetes bacterium]|nr:hypothetical protein [Planctomycetota bacterium]